MFKKKKKGMGMSDKHLFAKQCSSRRSNMDPQVLHTDSGQEDKLFRNYQSIRMDSRKE